MGVSSVAPGGLYPSLTTWAAGLPSTLAEDEYAELGYFPGGLDDQLDLSGIVSSPSARPIITVSLLARANGLKFDSTKFYLAPTSPGLCIRTWVQYTVIEHLQILPEGSAYSVGIYVSANDVTIRNNLIDGQNSANNDGIYRSSSYSNTEVYRNTIYGCDRSYFGPLRLDGTGASKIYQNVVYDNASRGIVGGGASCDCRNNASFNNGVNFAGTFDTVNSCNNATNSASGAPGSNNIYSLVAADQFKDLTPGAEDFHLKSSSSCIEAGAVLGAPYNVDAEGDVVTTINDIGADVYTIVGVMLSGTAANDSTATGTAQFTVPVVGASAAIVTNSGTISVTLPGFDLSGGSAVVTENNGNLSASFAFGGGAIVDALNSAFLSHAVDMGGATISEALNNGDITLSFDLHGGTIAEAVNNGVLSVTQPGVNLSGASKVSASNSGTAIQHFDMAGASAVVSDNGGVLETVIDLSAVSASAASVVGSLTVSTSFNAAAIANALNNGQFSFKVDLGGASIVDAVNSGTLNNTMANYQGPPLERCEVVPFEQRVEEIPFEQRYEAA